MLSLIISESSTLGQPLSELQRLTWSHVQVRAAALRDPGRLRRGGVVMFNVFLKFPANISHCHECHAVTMRVTHDT